MKKIVTASALLAVFAVSSSAFACGGQGEVACSINLGADSSSVAGTQATVMAGNIGNGGAFAVQASGVQVSNMTTATGGVDKSDNTVGAGTGVTSLSTGKAFTVGANKSFGNAAGFNTGGAGGQSAGSGYANAVIDATIPCLSVAPKKH